MKTSDTNAADERAILLPEQQHEQHRRRQERDDHERGQGPDCVNGVCAAELEPAAKGGCIAAALEQGCGHCEPEDAQPHDRGQDEEAPEKERGHEQNDADREGNGQPTARRPLLRREDDTADVRAGHQRRADGEREGQVPTSPG